MKTLVVVTRVLLVVLVAGSTARAAAPKRAAEAVERAQLAMAGKRYVEAAEGMEEAYRHDPDPLWLANAGYARMLAAQPDRAVELLSQALADKRLVTEARAKATDRLAHASSARALLARAEEARHGGDLATAARAYDEVIAHVAVGTYYLAAGEAYERAGELATASERYQSAVAQLDLGEEQRREAAAAIARVAAAIATGGANSSKGTGDVVELPKDPPVAPDRGGPVAGWVLVGSGAAALGLGVVSYVLMDGKTSDFEARKQGQSFVGSESEARALEDEAQTWWLVGTIATGVGVAAAATGLVLVLTHDSGPTTRGAVDVTGSLLPDGGLVMVRAGF